MLPAAGATHSPARAILIGDEVFAKVGAYVLGNVVISVIAAAATSIWLSVFDVPYPLLLGIFVGVFDLVPVVGSTIAGVVVGAVALTVSLPVYIATIVFFVVFRLAEDYLLVPRVIGRAVKVPALTTVVAVLDRRSSARDRRSPCWDCRRGSHPIAHPRSSLSPARQGLIRTCT